MSPHEYGYWELRAEWNVSSKFSKYVVEGAGNYSGLSDVSEEIKGASSFDVDQAKGIVRKMSEEQRKVLLIITTRLSHIFSVFRYLYFKNKNKKLINLHEDEQFISSLNMDEFISFFPDAWDIFNEKIYFNDFTSSVTYQGPFYTKNALVTFFEVPRSDRQLHIVSMSKQGLVDVAAFYEALGVVSNLSIVRVFAPDEALFSPYFPLVSSVLNSTVDDKRTSNVFERALAYYDDKDYQHCISSLGLITEDYLQRIYTTLLREALPSGLTLGSILNKLSKKIDVIFPTRKIAQKNIEPLFNKIKNMTSSVEVATLQPLLRELVEVIKDDRKRFIEQIDEINNPKKATSIFPPKLDENINELLRWRNAASHNSRVALGAHEADRSLYCLIGLIVWWQEQIANLDWDDERNSIIEKLLVTAKA